MQTHYLKTHPAYFDAIERGEKLFEIRRDDRGFQKGDVLCLQRTREDRKHEVDFEFMAPRLGERHKAKREIYVAVKWILTGGQFGLKPGFVCMSIERLPNDR